MDDFEIKISALADEMDHVPVANLRNVFIAGAQAARSLITVNWDKWNYKELEEEVTRLEKELAEALKQPMALRPPENDKEIFDFIVAQNIKLTKENEELRAEIDRLAESLALHQKSVETMAYECTYRENQLNEAKRNFVDELSKVGFEYKFELEKLTAQNAMMREALEKITHDLSRSGVPCSSAYKARECLSAIDKEMK